MLAPCGESVHHANTSPAHATSGHAGMQSQKQRAVKRNHECPLNPLDTRLLEILDLAFLGEPGFCLGL